MSADQMIEKLHIKYPGRFSIPGYTEVRQEISVLMLKQKNGSSNSLSRGISQSYADQLQDYLTDNPNIKPREALPKLTNEMKDTDGKLPADFPPDKQIKTKFNSLKSKAKKQT